MQSILTNDLQSDLLGRFECEFTDAANLLDRLGEGA